jgi:aryl-alcohol dehydrogenase-like predicted oxidoreductase
MTSLREEGLCDNIGLSIHKRSLAYDIYLRDIFDIFMLRYNAAHRGLEQDFLDRLDPGRLPGVVSYTATRWMTLLQRPRGWDEALPRPGDCYRFPLSHPRVTATWMSPKNIEELESNLAVVSEGPLKAEEDAFIRRFGDAVHAQKRSLYSIFFERSAGV